MNRSGLSICPGVIASFALGLALVVAVGPAAADEAAWADIRAALFGDQRSMTGRA